MAASVLYDQPGPRAKVRNRILAVITIVVVAAIVGAVMYIGLCLILSGVARYAEYRINKQPGTKKARAKMESVQAS